MDYLLRWENESVIRCEVRGFISRFDWLVPINESAGMAILQNPTARLLFVIPFFTFPFPKRPFRMIKQTVLAGHSYGFGLVLIVAFNPVTRLLIHTKLMDDDLRGKLAILTSMKQAHALLKD
jgi:hypothetical protein